LRNGIALFALAERDNKNIKYLIVSYALGMSKDSEFSNYQLFELNAPL
jgi:hypothetical protein